MSSKRKLAQGEESREEHFKDDKIKVSNKFGHAKILSLESC